VDEEAVVPEEEPPDAPFAGEMLPAPVVEVPVVESPPGFFAAASSSFLLASSSSVFFLLFSASASLLFFSSSALVCFLPSSMGGWKAAIPLGVPTPVGPS
jgi:hypothetical protein